MKVFRALLLGLAAVAVVVTLLPQPVAAQSDPDVIDPGPPEDPEGPGSGVQGCLTSQVPGEDDDDPDASERDSARDYLPLFRWGDLAAGDLHTRLDSTWYLDLGPKLNRDIVTSQVLSLGNSLWGLSASLIEFAINFDMLCTIGSEVDTHAASIGNPLLEPGSGPSLLLLAVVGTILLAVWRRAARQGRPPWGMLGRVIVVIALFAVMLAGATNSGQTERGTHYFGYGSPGWAAITLNDAIATMASAPAAAIAFGEDDVDVSTLPDDDTGAAAACGTYMTSLRGEYRDAYGDGPLSSVRGAVPLLVSSMWEETGLRTWTSIQFGADNPFADQAYCRMLERRTETVIPRQRDLSSPGAEFPVTTAGLLQDEGSVVATDQAMVFWAACNIHPEEGTAEVDEHWEALPSQVDTGGGESGGAGPSSGTINPPYEPPEGEDGATEDGKQLSSDDCMNLGWGAGGDDFHDTAQRFNWGTGEDYVRLFTDPNQEGSEATSHDEVRDYMLHLHGHSHAAGTAGAITYLIASLIMLAVFGLISVGVIVAKTASTVMILFVFIVLVIALVGASGWQRAGRFAKTYVGITIFVFGLQFLLALIALVTGMANTAGVELFGAGTPMQMIWLGFSPIVAVIVLHMLFKHALQLPSPFMPSGAFAWAGQMGGAGASAGAGLDRMARGGQNTVRNAASRLRRGGKGAAGTGRGKTPTDKMKPKDQPGVAGEKPQPELVSAHSGRGLSKGQTGNGQGAVTDRQKPAGKPRSGNTAGNGHDGTGRRSASVRGDEARQRAEASKQRRKDDTSARKWHREGEGRYDDKTKVGRVARGTADRAKDAASGKMAESWEKFRSSPVRQSAAAARKVAKPAGMAAAATLVGASAPVAAAGAAAYALHRHRRSSDRPDPQQREQIRDYNANHRHQLVKQRHQKAQGVAEDQMAPSAPSDPIVGPDSGGQSYQPPPPRSQPESLPQRPASQPSTPQPSRYTPDASPSASRTTPDGKVTGDPAPSKDKITYTAPGGKVVSADTPDPRPDQFDPRGKK